MVAADIQQPSTDAITVASVSITVPETKLETVEEFSPVEITNEPETAVETEEITEEDVAAAFGVTPDDAGDDDIEDDANAL